MQIRHLYFIPALLVTLSATATTSIHHHARAVTGRYMVLLDKNVTAAAYDGIVESLKGTYGLQIVTRWRELPRGFVASVPVSGAERLATDPRVRIVEEDFPISFQQSGTQLTSWNGNYLWFLDRLDESTFSQSTQDSTYNMCPEGRSVNAYIIDGGVRNDHEQFTFNEPSCPQLNDPGCRVQSYTFANGAQGDPDTLDGCPAYLDRWHATAVATVLGGTTTGASKAHIISLRVADCNNHGLASDVVTAIHWIRSSPGSFATNDDHRSEPGVVNLSSFQGDWTTYFATLDAAVSDRVDATQIPFFVSANNFSADACKFSPASLAYTNTNHAGKVFSVGGTSLGGAPETQYIDYRWQTWTGAQGDQINVGRESGSNGGDCISIYAPACNIYVGKNSSPTDYGVYSGTSFSAPLAAAVAARYIELTGNRNYQQVFDYLLSVAGSSLLINHVETPEYWMCWDDLSDTYPTYPSGGVCPGNYIGQDDIRGGPKIHFSPTTNSSNAGMLYSPMSCP
jgi:serine protease